MSIAIDQIAQRCQYEQDTQNSGKVTRLEKQIAKHKEMKAKEYPPDESPMFIRLEK
jgi:hypothetical protein